MSDFMLILLVGLAFLVTITPGRAQVGPEPLPTMLSTSWAATPTATVPAPPMPRELVYLPIVVR